jgi:hypothetical protein
MNTKTCKACNTEKEITEFYSTKSFHKYKGKVDYMCKTCRNGDTLKYHRGPANKTCTVDNCDKRHYAKGYCRLHYDRVRVYGRTEVYKDIIPLSGEKVLYREVNGKKVEYLYSHEIRLKHKYHMTLEQWYAFAEKGCNVCGTQIQEGERNLHVDHDHKCCPGAMSCGKCIRGVVCNRCNSAIGMYERNVLREDYFNREKIINYLVDYDIRRRKEELK